MDWEAWSREGWNRHAPGVDIAALGDGTIHGFAQRMAAERPDKVAVRILDEEMTELTFAELDKESERFASDFRPRSVVPLTKPVSAAWIARYLGILRAGAVALPLNPTYTASELNRYIALARSAPLAGDVALIAFTSGTTGEPKAVPLTHRNLLTSIRSAMVAWRWSSDDVLVHALPLYHQHGLGGLHATLIAGSQLSLLPRFDLDDLDDAIEWDNSTVLFAVPEMYQRLTGLRAWDCPLLRLCISGSAPLSEGAARAAEQVLGRRPLVRYGLTESGLDVSQVYGAPRPGTVGVPLPGVLVRLAEDGEIQMRGPQVFSGYLGGEPAFTDDGWFRTGDLGRLDDSGELVIDGRSKEMIITGGMKVMPREVELALERHPSVAEAAVAGVASEQWGEQVTAWVVLRGGATFDANALIAYVRASLAPYKTPKQVFRVDSLPRNAVGKVDRKRLLPG
jgi:acyl-CoA synthetase (AMP-forming)/AMP-acid ligase II